MVVVSIIMSSYNHGKYIQEVIESVLNQSFSNFEFIIIDDCSTDNSRETIKKYSQKDNRIKIFFHDKNEGVAKTLNDGINEAKGKFIALIDSDDLWDRKKLEKQLKILNKNEDLIVWTEGELIDEKGRSLKRTFTEKHRAIKKKKSGNIFLELIKENYIFKSSLIFKKKNLGNIKFNERLKILDDYLFEVRMARKYKFHFIKEPLTKYRIHGTNITLNGMTIMKELFIVRNYFLKKYYKEIPKNIKFLLCSEIVAGFLQLSQKKNAIPYVYKGFKIYPLNPKNVWFLFNIFFDSHIILSFISILLKPFQNFTKNLFI